MFPIELLIAVTVIVLLVIVAFGIVFAPDTKPEIIDFATYKAPPVLAETYFKKPVPVADVTDACVKRTCSI